MKNILSAFGLDEKASQVYLATLGLGTASVQQIARGAGLKRPTAYVYIEKLLLEGLLEKIPFGKREYYRAVNPHILETQTEKHLQEIREALPHLEALQLEMKGRPNIRVLEGEKGLASVYAEISQANSLRFWSNLATFELLFDQSYEKLATAIRTNEIVTKEIIADTPESKRSTKRYAEIAGKTYSAKLATVEGIQNDSAIFGDVVALFRIHEYNLFVVRIEDATIATTMRAIFDMAWQRAETFI